MIVMKFGGTSVQNAECIRRAVDIVIQHRDQQPVVVVSAIGTTTKTLLEVGKTALTNGADAAGVLLDQLVGHHRSILADLDVAEELAGSTDKALSEIGRRIAQLLEGVSLLQQLTPRTEDAIICHGERFSTLLFAAAAGHASLDVAPVDAATVIITDARFRAARPDRGEIQARARETILPLLEQRRIPLVEGFIGATRDGVPTTMGFEASDYTASLLAAALDASEIQIWTDVGGILTTGRPDVEGVLSIRELSFEEAAELSFFGAKVLHPNTVEPAVERNIPVRILHSRHPEGTGTTIFGTPAPGGVPVKSIAVKDGVITIRVRSRGPALVHRTLWSIGEMLDRHEISPHLLAASGDRVVLVVAADTKLEGVLRELGETLEVSHEENCVIVSLVGEDVRDTPGLAARATRAIEDIPLLLVSYGASDTSVSLVVSQEVVHEVVVKLHGEFFGEGIPEGMFARTDVEASL